MSERWTDVDAAVPLLLLPLRLETRSARTRDGVELRVRIYPDDVALDRTAGTAALLPDCFRVVVVQGERTVFAVGEPVRPEDVVTGTAGDLDTLADELDQFADPRRTGPLDWLNDYEQARTIGMAVSVPVLDAPVDRVLVVGVRGGRDPDDESTSIGGLLAGHAAEVGAEFLPVGTPTNNTERGRSAWTRRVPVPAESPAAQTPPGSAATRLAGALGLPDDAFAGWSHGDDQGDTAAGAMSTALWPVTWDRFLDHAVRPGLVTRDVKDQMGRHASTHVRGRGPLPSVRVGRQPYGVLPVTASTPGDGVTHGPEPLLDRLWRYWEEASGLVPTTRTGPLVDVLPRILGQAPVSRAVRVRRVLGTGGVFAQSRWDREDQAQVDARLQLAGWLSSATGLGGVLAPFDLLGRSRPLGLPLADDADPDVIDLLLQEPPATPDEWTSVLQVLLALSSGALWAARKSLVDPDRELGPARYRDLLDGLEADDLDTLGGRDTVERAIETLEEVSVADPSPFVRARGQLTTDLFVRRFPVAVLRPRPIDAVRPGVRGDRLLALQEVFRAAERYASFRQALEALRNTTTEERTTLVAETLDCASHRYDAWVTSVASSRLAAARQARPSGLAIGAYGWVEDLVLRPAVDLTGVQDAPTEVIQAPGVPHAATAAVLRGARLTHSPNDKPGQPLDLDLSSPRVRAALDVLQGMQTGQTLGALLGYRFERWLHEFDKGQLNQLVPALRRAAPLVAAKLVDRIDGAPVGAELESAATGHVVDGLRLLELAAQPGRLATAVAVAPPGWVRYGGTQAEWKAAVDRHWPDVLVRVERLGNLLDAVSDLLLAEGVHQLVAGNPAGSQAAMSAFAGDALPPSRVDVVASPPDTIAIDHRVVVLLPPGAVAPTDGWARTPRAELHPALERWARSVLGPATGIALTSSRTLAAANVAALDVVAAAEPQERRAFWARLRRSVTGLPEEPGTNVPSGNVPFVHAWSLAAQARAVLAGSRPVTGHDLAAREQLARPLPTDAVAPRGLGLGQVANRLGEATRALADLRPADVGGDLLALADGLAGFGISSTVDPAALDPSPDEPADATATDRLRRHVDLLLAERERRLATARAALANARAATEQTEQLELLGQAAQALFGDGLPLLPPVAEDDQGQPFTDAWPGPRRLREARDIRPWVARMSRVRPAVARYAELLLGREAVHGTLKLRVVQLAGEYPTWVGSPFAGGQPGPATSYVVEAASATSVRKTVSGFVVDGWIEKVPRRRPVDPRVPPAQQEHHDIATTGLAVHANGPDSRAPQALLLAVSPGGRAWSADSVVDLVDRTRRLARMRMLPYHALPAMGAVLPAAQVTHASLQGDAGVDPALLTAIDARVLEEFRTAGAVTHALDRELGS